MPELYREFVALYEIKKLESGELTEKARRLTKLAEKYLLIQQENNMVHVAIMKKSWGLTAKILTGEKTIETRWYKNKSRPWDMVKEGDIILFKDSGEPVTVKAEVTKVEQFCDLNEEKIDQLLKKYSQRDLGSAGITKEIQAYVTGKNYAVIIHLKNPQSVKPFEVNKTGFGAMSAWLCVKDIKEIKI
jgi:ASC-1-like (ASCH) protein